MLGPFGRRLLRIRIPGGVLSSWSVWPYPFIIMLGHDLMVCLQALHRAAAGATPIPGPIMGQYMAARPTVLAELELDLEEIKSPI